jgi:predicted NBD/HSP70 family sugar kinase
MTMLTVGIDVGGTKTACVVTDTADQILFHDVVPTDANGLADQIVGLARRAVTSVNGSGDAVAAIGVAIPGQVEPRSGTADLAVNLGAQEIDLGSTVERETGLPCFVEHDARAAATWVYESGAAATNSDHSDLAYLSIGTGIAAGIVLNGRPLRGASGLAGEVGHIVVDPAGAKCPCGSVGCLETIAAGPAIASAGRKAAAASAADENRPTTLTNTATAGDVFRAAAAGDEAAQQIARNVGEHLARAVRGLVLTLGVQRIVIGGGVAASGDALLSPIKEALGRERRTSRLVETAFAAASLEVLPPNLEPGARGAASIARQRISAQQREGVAER